MSRPNHRHLPLLCLLLLSLLASQASAFGYVWCIGADGHTRIEDAANGACGEAGDACVPAPGDPRPVLSADDEHCGPCLDLPANGDSLHGRTRVSFDSERPQLAPVSLPTPPASPFVRLLTARLIPDPPPRPAESIRHHRTVVLLN